MRGIESSPLMALSDAEPQKVGLLQASVTDTDRFYQRPAGPIAISTC